MSILLKAIFKFTVIPFQIPMALFMEIEKKNPKIHTEPLKNLRNQSNLEKE
jgi:hypothetical protein